jgi:hypothetical protein
MIVLLYTFLTLSLIGGGVFCSVLAYIMLSDALTQHKGKFAAAGGGMMMLAGAAACFATFLWMLNNSPL